MGFESVRESQLTEDKLKMGYWWVTHKVQVRRAFSVFMVFFDLALVGFGAFGFLDYYFGTGVQEQLHLSQISRLYSDYGGLRQLMAPVDLTIETVNVLPAGDGAFDIVAKIVNRNPKQWAEFDFQFVSGGPLGQVSHDFVLPGTFKYIHLLDLKSASRPGTPEVQFTNLAWHRVNAHVIGPDFPGWARERLNLTISDVEFKPPDPKDQLTISRATFKVKNFTGYGYRRIGFFVSLIGNGALSGVNYVTISDLRPGDVRQVDASWFSAVPSVSSVEVVPDVNIFDDLVYIPPGQ